MWRIGSLRFIYGVCGLPNKKPETYVELSIGFLCRRIHYLAIFLLSSTSVLASAMPADLSGKWYGFNACTTPRGVTVNRLKETLSAQNLSLIKQRKRQSSLQRTGNVEEFGCSAGCSVGRLGYGIFSKNNSQFVRLALRTSCTVSLYFRDKKTARSLEKQTKAIAKKADFSETNAFIYDQFQDLLLENMKTLGPYDRVNYYKLMLNHYERRIIRKADYPPGFDGKLAGINQFMTRATEIDEFLEVAGRASWSYAKQVDYLISAITPTLESGSDEEREYLALRAKDFRSTFERKLNILISYLSSDVAKRMKRDGAIDREALNFLSGNDGRLKIFKNLGWVDTNTEKTLAAFHEEINPILRTTELKLKREKRQKQLALIAAKKEEQRRQLVAEKRRKEAKRLIAQGARGPFSSGGDGYLNHLYQGNYDVLAYYDEQYLKTYQAEIDLMLAPVKMLGALTDSVLGKGYLENRVAAELRQSSLHIGILATYLLAYPNVYEACMDANPARFTLTRSWQTVTKNLLGNEISRSQVLSDSQHFYVNNRFRHVFSHVVGSSPDSAKAFEAMFGRDSEVRVSNLIRSVRSFMLSHSCQSEPVKQFEERALEYFAITQQR